MKDKKRLYEVYSKVNKLSINEDDSQEFDELKDDITYDIKTYFKADNGSRMFNNGIYSELTIRIQGDDFRFKMPSETGFVLNESSNGNVEEVNYTATYNSDLSSLDSGLSDVTITLPVIIDIEKNFVSERIYIDTEIWIEPENVEIKFN